MSGVTPALRLCKGCFSQSNFNSNFRSSLKHSQLLHSASSRPYNRLFSTTSPIMSRPDITLYTAQTPNGIKISIALEELGYVNLPLYL